MKITYSKNSRDKLLLSLEYVELAFHRNDAIPSTPPTRPPDRPIKFPAEKLVISDFYGTKHPTFPLFKHKFWNICYCYSSINL